MKKKILVANRSEIACRIFQTIREMGMIPVGIVAPGDESSRHLTYAEEIQRVTGYLEISSIVEAAKKSGATLIHPGYGFLSERPAFARAVEKAGLIFIGPRADTMELMGGKIRAKQLAAEHQVPTLPWVTLKPGQDLHAEAKKIGFPLLIKASAGGGGKGMRVVNKLGQLQDAAESASAEAVAAFGDGTLFLERLLVNPRHIEVQVFGDGQGGGVHLHERECSLQRRHQKVWEEATAPHLSDATRKKLFTAALNLVRATKYRNAGTLEFLYDAAPTESQSKGRGEAVYFLEMNTRLQVEHPVTEAVTGVDLVAAQITQALNPERPVFKDAPIARGHAIELRLYAEDPMRDFMPTPGQVTRLKWPTGTGIRIESGIEEGQQIGIQFDSMLGKLIVQAPDRPQALARLKFALEDTLIAGVGTNLSYLRTLLDHPNVQSGHVHTGFLETEFAAFLSAEQTTGLKESDYQLWLAAKEAGLASGSRPDGLFRLGEATRESVESPWKVFLK